MSPTYEISFPRKENLNRFQTLLKENAGDIPLIREALESLRVDPRPAKYGFEEVPSEEEVLFLLSHLGFPFEPTSPSITMRLIAKCRIKVGPYSILYDIMDDLKIVWVFQIRKENAKP